MFKNPREMRAIGRISNSFMYEAQLFHCGPRDELVSLDEYLNAKAAEGWKLHTIDKIEDGEYFCVWEKLDYGEAKA
jgi:hypothetical protein